MNSSNFLKPIVTRYSGGIQQPMHCDKYSRISIVLAGELAEDSKNASVRAKPMDIVIKSNHAAHENRYGKNGAVLLSLEIDNYLLSLNGNYPLEWIWMQQHKAFKASAGLLEACANDNSISIFSGVCELLSSVSATINEAVKPHKFRNELALVKEQILTETEIEFDTKLKAKELGIHPVHLVRIYKEQFGTTMQEEKQIRRVSQAIELLIDKQYSVSEIAQCLGFFDQSHFVRTFKRHMGLSPSYFQRYLAKY